MAIKLDKSRPICPQIEEQICILISNGTLKNGEKVMSVRELAVEASVNPNTVQKAFEGLEEKGLLKSVRGSGWFVGENSETAKDIVNSLIISQTKEYLGRMHDLGLSNEQILNLLRSDDNE